MVVYVCGQSRGISTASLSRAKAGVELATGAVFLWGSTRPWTLQGAKPCPPSPMERKMSVWSCRSTPGKNEAWRYPSGSNERARGQGQEKKKAHFFRECGRQLRHTATHIHTTQAPRLLPIAHTSLLLAWVLLSLGLAWLSSYLLCISHEPAWIKTCISGWRQAERNHSSFQTGLFCKLFPPPFPPPSACLGCTPPPCGKPHVPAPCPAAPAPRQRASEPPRVLGILLTLNSHFFQEAQPWFFPSSN